ncbi:c-type cytochrome [Nafulsella turpanensis]|uniref:c-type cytochrome n=1 Tax=Nafulsella turpanensis TaxID=1265690 RepID=UPI000345D359|nr:cytochrome c [Nafulsella turpanensis]
MKILKNKSYLMMLLLVGVMGMFMASCGGGSEEAAVEQEAAAPAAVAKAAAPTDPMQNKGIGPVTEVHLAAIDEAMVGEGKTIFESKCSACHKIEERYIGPALKGVTERRTAEWIMNMILNPEQMVKEDPIAKQLLAEYMAPMANQNLTEDEARKVLEYFRTLN